MSEGSGIGARRRALSVAASTLVVALACYGLYLASRTSGQFSVGAQGVDVIMIENERPPRVSRVSPPRVGVPTPARNAVEPSRIAADRAELAQMLSCFGPRERRPSSCPREAIPSEGARGELPTGGDFYEPPPIDRNRIYTPAELNTLVMPPCPPSGCVRLGPPPPPPSRSAEQICEDGGLGGPCRPPEFREEDVVRRRHSD